MQHFLKFSLSVFLLTASATLAYFMLAGGTLHASEPKILNAAGTYQYQMQTNTGQDGKWRFEILGWNTETGESRWYWFDNYNSYAWQLENKQLPAVDY
jgi:hypothetical protein